MATAESDDVVSFVHSSGEIRGNALALVVGCGWSKCSGSMDCFDAVKDSSELRCRCFLVLALMMKLSNIDWWLVQ